MGFFLLERLKNLHIPVKKLCTRMNFSRHSEGPSAALMKVRLKRMAIPFAWTWPMWPTFFWSQKCPKSLGTGDFNPPKNGTHQKVERLEPGNDGFPSSESPESPFPGDDFQVPCSTSGAYICHLCALWIMFYTSLAFSGFQYCFAGGVGILPSSVGSGNTSTIRCTFPKLPGLRNAPFSSMVFGNSGFQTLP